MEQSPIAGLTAFYINSIQTALARTINRDGQRAKELIHLLTLTMNAGDRNTTKMMLEEIAVRSSIPNGQQEILFRVIVDLAAITPSLLKEVVSSVDLEGAMDASYRIGRVLVELEQNDLAYNLFETAYHFSDVLEQPSFLIAKDLLKYSNPANVVQHYAAIWRYAIAHLFETLKTKTDWLAAVDAVELALNVPVEHPQLQQQLCDQLMRVLRDAEGTPIHPLVAIIHLQVPEQCVDPETRSKVIGMLLGDSLPVGDSPAIKAGIEVWAAARAQNYVDDMRLGLTKESPTRPYLTWHDLSLTHSELTNAVPLRRSLVVDVNRTGPLLMELIHEIAHAFSLIGPIGWARTTLRVAVQFAEFLLMSSQPQVSDTDEIDIATLPELPTDRVSRAIAEIQLASAFRSTVLEAVWKPWLEGVAMYIELLCDPKDDLAEISAVHEAVRSLIDYGSDKRQDESEEDYIERQGSEAATHFENFCSEAIRRHSWFGHKGYLEPNKLRDLNIGGYLLVRSLVARWENTLGRRLEPIRAIKLLLNATRNGTEEALPDLNGNVTEFHDVAHALFAKWLTSLSRLECETLGYFFESVEPGEKGKRYYWRDGRPRRVADNSAGSESTAVRYWDKLQSMCFDLIVGVGANLDVQGLEDSMREITEHHKDTIVDLLRHYLDVLGLLPVGRDMARLVFVGDEGRVVVCPRTYMGLKSAKSSESWPRYSTRSFVLEGGADEVRRLRGLFAENRSARLLTTRLIDLVGHPDSPLQHPNISYVCHLLGASWHRFTVGDSFVPLSAEHKAFIELIKKRLYSPPFLKNEGATLASVHFLEQRLVGAVPNSSMANLVTAFRKLDHSRQVAFQNLAQAFGKKSAMSVEETFNDSLAKESSRSDIADYLYRTGRGEEVTPEHPALKTPLAQMAFTSNFSGIVPFGGDHDPNSNRANGKLG